MTKELQELSLQLRSVFSMEEKIAVLNSYPPVKEFMERDSYALFSDMPIEWELVLKQLVAIGQWDVIASKTPWDQKLLSECLEKLAGIDVFYAELGGIVGYQSKILSFLQTSSAMKQSLGVAYHPPSFVDIGKETEMVEEAVLSGIEALEAIAEMYPMGGAADRLHLVDEETGEELPAANLKYMGRSLLEGLIRDLQAREFLYFKLFGKQITTPVAIMTSSEKNNHNHLLNIFGRHNWFGRPKDCFRFFVQPLVPAVDATGNWYTHSPFRLLLKPSGHGVIWKLARDFGIFEWLETLGRTKALIRQISNPITSLDYGLLAFVGVGHKNDMIFGFASCPRLVQSAEGVNVVIEKETGEIVLTNIEYCDFEKFGIEDQPLKEGEPYSRFSSNTNILFADLKEVSRAVSVCPFPGLLINLKKATFINDLGEKRESMVARLESTMQNIADVFVEKKGDSFETKRTFVTYNRRHKTISTIKKAAFPGRSLEETPENCFYVQLQASRELLESNCGFCLPQAYSLSEYLDKGPDCVFLYHPALGPLYSIIRQKISGGKIALHSELQLEIADIELKNLDLEGSLLIEAENLIGHFDANGILTYSARTGRSILRNVKVQNKGVDWKASSPFWRNQFCRKESLQILLQGNSEFIAENVVFQGNHQFVVADGTRMRVTEEDGKLCVKTTKLVEDVFWIYSLNERRIELTARNGF